MCDVQEEQRIKKNTAGEALLQHLAGSVYASDCT